MIGRLEQPDKKTFVDFYKMLCLSKNQQLFHRLPLSLPLWGVVGGNGPPSPSESAGKVT